MNILWKNIFCFWLVFGENDSVFGELNMINNQHFIRIYR